MGPGRELTVRWRDEQVFEGGASGKPVILVDGKGAEATSPVELLLLAAATCSATDVVLILQKQRVALKSLEFRVQGTRRDTAPRCYTSIHFDVALSGDGADEAKARRAIDLSIEKYCSVLASLRPDISVTYDVVIR
ncbi:MAG TPA: OsmC family protein [Gemmatimonadales bacterium]|nr:OsmC family protein [Gemmatimonadales bacterium]